MRNSGASLIVIWVDNVPTTHCKLRRWSTRLICAWPTKPIQTGRTARTSSPSPPARCAKSSLTTPGVSRAQKRGGGALKIELDEAAIVSPEQSKEIVDLHEALERLGTLDSRKAQVVELKYFGGLNYDEIAEVLKISRVTVRRDWEFAKLWLYTELHRPALTDTNFTNLHQWSVADTNFTNSHEWIRELDQVEKDL